MTEHKKSIYAVCLGNIPEALQLDEHILVHQMTSLHTVTQ